MARVGVRNSACEVPVSSQGSPGTATPSEVSSRSGRGIGHVLVHLAHFTNKVQKEKQFLPSPPKVGQDQSRWSRSSLCTLGPHSVPSTIGHSFCCNWWWVGGGVSSQNLGWGRSREGQGSSPPTRLGDQAGDDGLSSPSFPTPVRLLPHRPG